jgi:hypothetical protein
LTHEGGLAAAGGELIPAAVRRLLPFLR